MHRLRRIHERPLRVVKLEARKPAHILRRVIERAVYARAVLPSARKRAKHRLAAAKREAASCKPSCMEKSAWHAPSNCCSAFCAGRPSCRSRKICNKSAEQSSTGTSDTARNAAFSRCRNEENRAASWRLLRFLIKQPSSSEPIPGSRLQGSHHNPSARWTPRAAASRQTPNRFAPTACKTAPE